jgi:hypothetical protein
MIRASTNKPNLIILLIKECETMAISSNAVKQRTLVEYADSIPERQVTDEKAYLLELDLHANISARQDTVAGHYRKGKGLIKALRQLPFADPLDKSIALSFSWVIERELNRIVYLALRQAEKEKENA